jgi:hypothetical protein
MAELLRPRPAPFATVSRLVRAISATATMTGAVQTAAELGRTLMRSPVGVLVVDGEGVHIVAGQPAEDRFGQLFSAQARSGPWLESYDTGEPVTCSYSSALTRYWPVVATGMGYGDIAEINVVPLRSSTRTVGALSVFRLRGATAPLRRDRDAARDFIEIGLTTLSLRHELSNTADEAEAIRMRLRDRSSIAIATGIVAERHGLSPSEATVALGTLARHLKQPLERAARLVVDGGVRREQMTALLHDDSTQTG